MSNYSLTATTRSDLHIGSGETLRQDFDFVVREISGQAITYRLDVDAVLEAKEEAIIAGGSASYRLPGQLLEDRDFGNDALFRYKVPGAPRSEKTYADVKACIKDVHDRPYIPGSSLKGALRTALAWAAWEELDMSLDIGKLDRRGAKFAAQPLEKKIFGRNPNFDLLRALHISDLHGPEEPGQGLALANTQVVTQGGRGSPVEMEVIRPGVKFHGSLSVDDYLFSKQARQLGFKDREKWLDTMFQRVQQHTRTRLETLLAWYQEAADCEGVVKFLNGLYQRSDRFVFLQLGWGGGWDSKTFGSRLQANKQDFERLLNIRKYRLQAVRGRNKPSRRPGDPFPESRNVVMRVDRPIAPLGWVMLEASAS